MLHKRCPPAQQLLKVSEAALSARSVGHQLLPDSLLSPAPVGARFNAPGLAELR